MATSERSYADPTSQPQASSAALTHARAVCALLFGPVGTRSFDVRYWNGETEPARTPASFALVIRYPGALRRMLFPPNELTIIEAALSGDIEIEGNMEAAMWIGDGINDRLKSPRTLFALLGHLRALPKVDSGEDVKSRRAANVVRRAGDVHEPERDQAAIRYHYDVGNDFYALWLDERMVYSCAYFASAEDVDEHLGDAQRAKLDLICRKLRLQPGDRLLDVGCGWGALIMHAVQHYGVQALGITLSEAQAALARERIAAAGIGDQCRVEIRDYRKLDGERFDKISSVGMVEHVGIENLPTYFKCLYDALEPGGLLLNHGIVSVASARPPSRWDWLESRLWKRDVFLDQYVFPDGRLGPLSAVVAGGELVGFETRDVESLREHYALTLRAWLARLERNAEAAIALTDPRTYRIWRLYMAGSAFGFSTGRLNVVQTLFVKQDAVGGAHLPLRRSFL
ncbi:MAG: cyclopropane-fatty-acyl-phospholipid synthase family protein [Gemmatimonadaceae bacterium]